MIWYLQICSARATNVAYKIKSTYQISKFNKPITQNWVNLLSFGSQNITQVVLFFIPITQHKLTLEDVENPLIG